MDTNRTPETPTGLPPHLAPSLNELEMERAGDTSQFCDGPPETPQADAIESTRVSLRQEATPVYVACLAALRGVERANGALTQENERLTRALKTMEGVASEYTDEAGRLRAALEFYGEEKHWIATGWQGDMDPSPCDSDKGKQARAALSKLEQQARVRR